MSTNNEQDIAAIAAEQLRAEQEAARLDAEAERHPGRGVDVNLPEREQ